MKPMKRCFSCFKNVDDYEIRYELQIIMYTVMHRESESKYVYVNTPTYQCICATCGTNSVYHEMVERTNNSIRTNIRDYLKIMNNLSFDAYDIEELLTPSENSTVHMDMYWIVKDEKVYRHKITNVWQCHKNKSFIDETAKNISGAEVRFLPYAYVPK